MIQFNLLPDVKLTYIKARRTKRLVMLVSVLVAGMSVAILIVMFLTVQVAQKKHITDLNKDIAAQEKTLKSTPDLDKVLTIQNQLNSLPAIQENKLETSRIFTYLQQVTPLNAFISSFEADFVQNTVTVTGVADTVVTINKFADTLKFATYTTPSISDGKPFSNVVTVLATDKDGATFTLTFSIDPVLFKESEKPSLVIPLITSTRSETEKPTAIFKAAPKEDN